MEPNFITIHINDLSKIDYDQINETNEEALIKVGDEVLVSWWDNATPTFIGDVQVIFGPCMYQDMMDHLEEIGYTWD